MSKRLHARGDRPPKESRGPRAAGRAAMETTRSPNTCGQAMLFGAGVAVGFALLVLLLSVWERSMPTLFWFEVEEFLSNLQHGDTSGITL